MRLVVDASVAIKWVIEETNSNMAVSIRRFELLAPDLLVSECCNTLWKLARRSELTGDDVVGRLDLLFAVPMTFVPAVALAKRTLDIALELGHPAYDLHYLACAGAYAARLVTIDNRLLRQLANSAFSHLAISLQDAAAN